MSGSADPLPDPLDRAGRQWPGMLDEQVDDPHQVIAANGESTDAVTAFDMTFYHGTRQ